METFAKLLERFLETAYQKVDQAIQQVLDLLAAS